jgi:hypothetical protein
MFTNLKVNGAGVVFTQADAVYYTRFVGGSFENSGSECGFDFGSGGTQPKGVSIIGAQIDMTGVALCNVANTVGLSYMYQEYDTTAQPSWTPVMQTNIVSGSGTVSSGTTGQYATFPSSGTTVSGHTPVAADISDVATALVQQTTGTRPTCDSSKRGYLWTVQGAGGVADATTQCQKDASDVYSWTAIGGGGGSGTVTSVTFTGDGTVLSSTPSSAVTTSGTVTATKATAAANTVLGNFTGSTATPTYGTVTSSQVNNTIALTGTDINTSNQVTETHLTSALPIAQGGTASITAAAALTALGGVAYSTAAQPTCDSSKEGWLYYVKASGATAGYLQLCLGQGSSAFAWTTK